MCLPPDLLRLGGGEPPFEFAGRHVPGVVECGERFVRVGVRACLRHRDTSGRSREIGGVLTAKGREAINYVYALSYGVTGTWRMLHQLWLDANNSLSAFAVAHGIAQAAGAAEGAALAAPVVEEKRAQTQTLLRALVAAAPRAIIERAPV